MKDYFFKLCEFILKDIDKSFMASFFLSAEDSQFIRFSQGKVRQSGLVKDASLSILLGKDQKEIMKTRRLTNDFDMDVKTIRQAVEEMTSLIKFVPVNPFSIWPEAVNHTEDIFTGELIKREETVKKILGPVQNLDLVGIYAGGKIFRGQVNSFGQKNWFEANNFNFDFSVYASNGLADKHSLSGSQWNEERYQKMIQQSIEKVELLEKDKKELSAGKYDVYFSPSAVTEVLEFLNYGAFSKAAVEDKHSSFCQLMDKKEQLSDKFHLSNDFGSGYYQPFEIKGFVNSDKVDLVKSGEMVSTLCSPRSGVEYECEWNSSMEYGCFLNLSGGNLDVDNVLETLGKGIYISNLWYTNYSNLFNARITGLTRYACFWIEDGKIQAPLNSLRFDESIFHMFGNGLEDFTKETFTTINNSTYGERSLGGIKAPGAIIRDFNFCL